MLLDVRYTRRMIRWSIFAALVVCATGVEAVATDISPAERAVSVGPCAAEGLFVTHDGKTPAGSKLAPQQVRLHSTRDDNELYYLEAKMSGTRPRGPGDRVLLCVGGRAFCSGSGGSNKSDWSADFAGLDKASAQAAEHDFGITRRDRSRLGDGLTWHFSVKGQQHRVGDALPISVSVKNGGKDTVRFDDSRGDRSVFSHYSFQVFKDGVQQADIGNPDGSVGGNFLSAGITLAPGQKRSVRPVDLKSWAAFATPGTYEVRCAYHLALANVADDRWDLTADEVIKVEISAQ
ncbi:MAG: hypothetical protein ABI321_13460 [Polyangia bacterium]